LSTPQEQFNQQETVSQFANRVRAKNPGAYDDAPDGDLVDRYLRKHPVYADRVALPSDFKLLRTSSGDSKLDGLYEQAGREHNVDPNLLLEQGRVESVNFNPKYIYQKGATSPKGAGGISQFMPGTAPSYGLRVGNGVDDRYDPAKAIPAQARMMRELLDKHNGNYDAALAAYNSGSGLSTQRALVNRQRNPETRKYVDTITGKVKSLPVLLNDSAPEVSPEEAAQPKTDEVAQPNADAFHGGEIVNIPQAKSARVGNQRFNTVQVRARAGDTPESLAVRYNVPAESIQVAGRQIAPVGSQSFGAVEQTPAPTSVQPAPIQTPPPASVMQPTPRTLKGATVRQMRPRQNAYQQAKNLALTQAGDLNTLGQKLLTENQQSAPFVPGVRTAQAGRRPQASIADVRQADDAALAQSGMNSVGPISSEQFIANKQANDEQNRVSSAYDNQIRSLIEANVRASIVNGGTVPYDTIAAPVEQQLKIYKEAVSKHPELRGHDPQTVANEVNRLGDLQSDPEGIRNFRKSGQDIGLPLLQGFKSSVGSTVHALGNLADVVNVGPQYSKTQALTDAASYLKEQGRGIQEGQQVTDLIDEPRNGQERFQRSLLRGVGATPGMLAKFEAFGIPTMIAEGGLSRADEGIGGVLKGAAESAVSLYGMQATGKILSPLWNGLTWTALPTAKGVLIDHKDLSDALGESIPGGVLAGVSAEGIENNLRSKGFEPFNLKSEDGRTATVYVDGEGNFYSARTRAAKSGRPDINANDATFDNITKGARLGQWTKGLVNADNLFDIRNRTSSEAPTVEPQQFSAPQKQIAGRVEGSEPNVQPEPQTPPPFNSIADQMRARGQSPLEPEAVTPEDAPLLNLSVKNVRDVESLGEALRDTNEFSHIADIDPIVDDFNAGKIDQNEALKRFESLIKRVGYSGIETDSKRVIFSNEQPSQTPTTEPQIAPESVSPVDATANVSEQSEVEPPHYSNSQNRRVRNTKNGNAGQFREGFKESNSQAATEVNQATNEPSVLGGQRAVTAGEVASREALPSTLPEGVAPSEGAKQPSDLSSQEIDDAWRKYQSQFSDTATDTQNVRGLEVWKLSSIPDFKDIRNLPKGRVVHGYTDGKNIFLKAGLNEEQFKTALQHEIEHVEKKHYPSFAEEYPELASSVEQSTQGELTPPETKPAKGQHGHLIQALFKSPGADADGNQIHPFLAQPSVRSALGLTSRTPNPDRDIRGYNDALKQAKERLAPSLGKPRASHISPDDLRTWASERDLPAQAMQALDYAVAHHENVRLKNEQAKNTVEQRIEQTKERLEKPKTPTNYQRTGVRRNNFDPSVHSLSEAIRRLGGVEPDSVNKGEAKRLSNKESGSSGLIRKGGLSAERMAERLWEEGYYSERPDPNQILSDAEEDLSGAHKHYSTAHQPDYEKEYYDKLPQSVKDEFAREMALSADPRVVQSLEEVRNGQEDEGLRQYLYDIAAEHQVSEQAVNSWLEYARSLSESVPSTTRPNQLSKTSQTGISPSDSRTESSLRRPATKAESSTGESASGNQNQNQRASIEQKKSALLGLLRTRTIDRAEYAKRLSDIESGKDINVVTGRALPPSSRHSEAGAVNLSDIQDAMSELRNVVSENLSHLKRADKDSYEAILKLAGTQSQVTVDKLQGGTSSYNVTHALNMGDVIMSL
jgi:hypothetical protein